MAKASIKDDMNNLLGNLGGLNEGDIGLGAGGGVSMGGVLAGAISAIVKAAIDRDEIPGWKELRDKYFDKQETNSNATEAVKPGTAVIGGGNYITGNKDTRPDVNIEKVSPETVVNPQLVNLPKVEEGIEKGELTTPVTTPNQTPEIGEPVTDNVANGDYTWNTEQKVQGIDLDEWKQWYASEREKAWEREDAIRKETQEREDNAWQRAIDDMRAAGINPNLVNASAAQAGGGITTATMGDSNPLVSALTTNGDILEKMLEQAFEGDENSKNRVMELITQIVGSVAQLMGAKMLSGK